MNEETTSEQTENNEPVNNTPQPTDQDLSNEKLHKAVIRQEDAEQLFDEASLEGKSLEDMVAEANNVLVLTPIGAAKRLKIIKKYFLEQYNELKNAEREAFDENNTDTEASFECSKESVLNQILAIEESVKQARAEEKVRIQAEQKKNLAMKHELLARLQVLVEQDETLESISEVKEIQKEWKTIRALPKETSNDLWDSYNTLLNRFYDNHGINIELKELDRQKNLEAKIELTKKVEAVLQERSLKRSFILLNKYHEEFKNTGPVPSESREPIWQAFKKASDTVYDAKRLVFNELEEAKEANLAKKQILTEKVNLLNAVDPRSGKEWNDKAKAFDALFEEWKKIGPVPKANNDAVWIQFNGVRNDFFTKRKEYYKEQNKGRNENLKAKEALCEKVESLKESKDWGATTKSILGLQEEWKKVGPVPEKINQAIWKRFRAGCDHFFNAKNEAFAGQREGEVENLAKKTKLIKELEALATKESAHKEAFAELKRINAAWREIGFVPHKALKSITSKYDEANKAVYTKYSVQIEDAKSANLSEHFKDLANSHNGSNALAGEEQNIKRRIGTLREEIASIERNMSFFAKSKTAEKMLKDFEMKIEKANKQIDKLKNELKALKAAKKEAEVEAHSEGDTTAESASAE
jgi:hypothetical protein